MKLFIFKIIFFSLIYSNNIEVKRVNYNLLNINNTDYYISLYKYYYHSQIKDAIFYRNKVCIINNNEIQYDDCYMINKIYKKNDKIQEDDSLFFGFGNSLSINKLIK